MSTHKNFTTTKDLIDKKYNCIAEIIKINIEIKKNQNLLNSHFQDIININDEEMMLMNKLFERVKFAQNCFESETIIQNSLSSICNHIIIEDMIDISPEHSQKIRYCTVCETTFDSF